MHEKQALRQCGFRPREDHETGGSPKVTLSNDKEVYPDGFLYFARHYRLDVEKEHGHAPERLASCRLWDRWAAVPEGDAREERGYWAALERLARHPANPKAKQQAKADGPGRPAVAVPLRGAVQAEVYSAVPLETIVVEDEDEYVEEVEDAEWLEGWHPMADDSELRSFAEVVCREYPRVCQDIDLLINVLGVFGVQDDPEVRARAWQFVQEKMRMELDQEFALHIQEEPESQACARPRADDVRSQARARPWADDEVSCHSDDWEREQSPSSHREIPFFVEPHSKMLAPFAQRQAKLAPPPTLRLGDASPAKRQCPGLRARCVAKAVPVVEAHCVAKAVPVVEAVDDDAQFEFTNLRTKGKFVIDLDDLQLIDVDEPASTVLDEDSQ